MGNEQPKKIGRINKTQLDVACLKAKIHLGMMRDRKNNQIIKGQKQLVAKIKNPSRNKTQEILIAERVVNGLKYAAACNQLMAYAASLKGQSAFISDNIANYQKMQPWLPLVYSLLYSSQHLGLSSLNQFKAVLRSLNDPMAVQKFVNPQLIQLLTPSPTPDQLNIYMVEMSERNGIPLETINMIGHKFAKDVNPPKRQSQTFHDMQRQLAENMKKNFNQGNNQGSNNQGYNNQGFNNHGNYNQNNNNNNNQGFNQGYGNQGYNIPPPQQPNSNYNQGNQGFYIPPQQPPQNYNQGNQGFYISPQQPPQNYNQGSQGFNQKGNQEQYIPKNPSKSEDINPYKGLSDIQHGPDFYTPSTVHNNSKKQNPRQFDNFDNILHGDDKSVDPIYPSVNMSGINNLPEYKPIKPTEQNEVKPPQFKNPTISQILRDFDI